MKYHSQLVFVPVLALTLAGLSACNKASDNANTTLTEVQKSIGTGLVQHSTEEFTRAIELDPKSANAYVGRAAVKYASGDRKGSIEDFTKAIELDKESAKAWSGRATAKYAEGDLSGALVDGITAARIMVFRTTGPVGN